jgi:hypothetical protein
MPATALITYNQQITYKKISANNQTKFAQIETEVENTELRDLLGVALLQDLQYNGSTAENVKLLAGTSFVNCDGNTIYHKGIRFVLAYLIYSRYIGESFVNDTFTGLVQKTRDDSEQLSEGQVRRLQENNRIIAMNEWLIIKEYLNLNPEDYPLWCSVKSKKPFTPRITGVRRTLTRDNKSYSTTIIKQ